MKSALLPAPGLLFGPYPERKSEETEDTNLRASKLPDLLQAGASRRFLRDVRRALKRREEIARMSAAEVEQTLRKLRGEMARDGLSDELIVEGFAVVSHVCEQALGMCPYHTQLLAARIMLDNRIAEMATGEGKTLAAGVSAATAALAGIPVHVMTSNDYLVERDAEKLRPLYSALGLSVDVVTQQMQADRRREAYSANVTYCTAKELAFDYLRDSMMRRGLRTDLHLRVARLTSASPDTRTTVLRGLCMAIVDEADSILIDEARVPLILAQQTGSEKQRDTYEKALLIANDLVEFTDFRLNTNLMIATLTTAGRARVERAGLNLRAQWRNRMHREELVCQALAALYLYHRDRHYLVAEGKVTIIDEMTGRVAPGRIWSRGLHQLIECKEGCDATGEQVSSTQITFQRFFRKYYCLGGMSGTVREARRELSNVYGLDVIAVPLRCPNRRRLLPVVVYPDRVSRAHAVVAEIARRQSTGQPILIGTDSVAESEELSRLLDDKNIVHAVLNARQDKAEADIVARAGTLGSITVATNMAGRGTDIPLGPGAVDSGGLHVISCQHNTSRRIDRQLIGRCARQGDPGSAQQFLCLDQPLVMKAIPRWLRALLASSSGRTRPRWLIRMVKNLPQVLEERRQRRQRRDMLKQDLTLDKKLTGNNGID